MNHEERMDIATKLLASHFYTEAESHAHTLLSETKPHEKLHAVALLVLGDCAKQRGNFDDAQTYAEQGLSIAETYNYSAEKIKAWTILSGVHTAVGKHDKALELYGNALEALEKSNDISGMAATTGNIGTIYVSLGDYNKALEYFNKALAVHEYLGELSRIATVTGNIGLVYFSLGNFEIALKFFGKALANHEKLNERSGIARLLGNIGSVYWNLGIFESALEYYSKALVLHEVLGEKSIAANIITNIGSVYRSMNKFDEALLYYQKAVSIFESLGQKSIIATVNGNIGNIFFELKSYQEAMQYYSSALRVHEELGEESGISINTTNVGNVYYALGDYDNALEYYNKALLHHKKLGSKQNLIIITGNIGEVYSSKEYSGYNPLKAEEYLLDSITMCEEIGAKHSLYYYSKNLADVYEDTQNWKEFAIHFKKFHEIKEEVQSEEATKQAELMEHRRKVEEAERDRQVKLARFQEREKILDNILPSQITERLIKGEQPIADKAENVSVFFSDIVGFTTLSQKMSAKELVSGLNELFIQFDILAKKHGLEKIKTIGDAYMAVCGVPVFMENHTERMACFAIDIQELFKKGIAIAGHNVNIRIGLHCGEVVAGVIGEQKFAYDLWGDAVNTASRMESHGEAGKIHVSSDFVRELTTNSEQLKVGRDGQQLITINSSLITAFPRGEMEIKGKGVMKTYFLETA